MNQNTINKINDDNECCGPRPPVPGKENRKSKVFDNVLIKFK